MQDERQNHLERSDVETTYSLLAFNYSLPPSNSNDNSMPATLQQARPGLVARLNLFDATMIVMGGIVGAGIFINPYVVARQVHTPALILMVWTLGGVGRTSRRICLRRASRALAANWRPVCVPAGSLSSSGRLRLRMGLVACDTDGRNGCGRDHLRALLRRTDAHTRWRRVGSRRGRC